MSRLKSAIRNLSAIGGSAFGGQSSILLALLVVGMMMLAGTAWGQGPHPRVVTP